MPHRRIARRLSAWNLLRWEMGTVIGFHACVGLVILLAPAQFVITSATWPVFYFVGRLGMAVAFLATAAVAAACWWRPRPLLQLATWVPVYMLGAGWLAGFVLAIQHGGGGLYGVVVWSVLLLLWASTAVRLGLGNGGTGVARTRRRSGQ
jgi:hypothetical protein